jgi:hypothetical protein
MPGPYSANHRSLLVGGGAAAAVSDYVSSGLVMLLDGSDTSTMTRTVNRVDAWNDKLGSGKSVATSANGVGFNPSFVSSLFSNSGGVRFTRGSNLYLESAAAFTSLNWANGWTVLFAGQITDGLSFFGASDSSNALGFGGLGTRLGQGSSMNVKEGYPISTNCVFGSRYAGAATGGIKPILDGSAFTSVTGTSGVGVGNFGKLQVGGLLPGQSSSMDVRAIYFYNRALSDDELTRMNRYIKTLYGFADLAAPTWNIVVDGNSLANGSASLGPNWTMDTGIRAATGTPTPRDYVNVALSGVETPTLTTRAAATVDTLYNTAITAKKRILIIWEISNHLINASVTDVIAYAAIKAYCQARKSAGWKVIVCTCLPRTQAGINANFETYRTSVNASINANAISEGWADAVADIGGDATIGAAGAPNSTTNYNADKIHLNSTGHGIAKTYITNAINLVTA